MIRNLETLEKIFKLVKYIKKPLVKIYPDGRIIGTDEQFASLNVLEIYTDFVIDIPYIFRTTEISAFMREITKTPGSLSFNQFEISLNGKNVSEVLINHLELNYKFDDLYNTVMISKNNQTLYNQENIQELSREMFDLKSSDGAKLFNIENFLMTSFNSIHPATKTDRVDLIIRDYDIYSFMGEFIIFKKKDKYELHEFLRFRKLS